MPGPLSKELVPLRYRPAAVALAAFVVLCVVILVTGAPPPASVSLVKGLIWPALTILAVLLFHDQVETLLSTLNRKVDDATNIALPYIKIEVSPDRIPVPKVGESVTSKNVALLHTSFARPDKTREYNDGLTYYQIEVVVIAPASTLDRIESVTYRLHPAYPTDVHTVVDRRSRFKLKELANGTSIVRAELKLKGQSEPMYLNRFIDLRPDGPRI